MLVFVNRICLLIHPSISDKMERCLSLFIERKEHYFVDKRTFQNGASKLKAKINLISKHRAQDR